MLHTCCLLLRLNNIPVCEATVNLATDPCFAKSVCAAAVVMDLQAKVGVLGGGVCYEIMCFVVCV